MKTMFGFSLPPVVCGRDRVLFMLFVFVLRVVLSKMDNPDKLATSRKDEEKTQHNMCFTPLFCKQIQIT